MPVRMTGMISGMDTESLIKSMVDAQRLKNKKTTDKSTLLEWKQDKWKELNTKLFKLYQEDLSKLRLQGNYNTKKAESSNSTVLDVKASNGSANGTQKISVSQLARAEMLTGGEIKTDKNGKATTSNTKLVDLGIDVETLLNISHKDKNITLEVTDKTTISDFVNAIKSAGLNASFDSAQKRLFISSKESGVDNAFNITATKTPATTTKNQILSMVGYNSLSASDKKTVDNMIKVLSSDTSVAEDITASIEKLQEFAEKKVENDIRKSIDNDIRNEVSEQAANDEKALIAEEVAVKMLVELKEAERQKGELSEEEIDALTIDPDDEALVQAQETAIAASEKRINAAVERVVKEKIAEENALEDNRYQQAIAAAKEAGGAISQARDDVAVLGATYEADSKDADKIATINSKLQELGLDSKAIETKGENSKYSYNGVEFEASSNEVTVNGLTLSLKGVGEASVSVSNNTQANYDMIKSFITNYNDVLKEMNELFYAPSARGYSPLSEEEQEAMTEKQIDKWEEKIKTSILRRDDALGSVLGVLNTAIMSTVEVDGKKYSLSSFGIVTSSDYTEKGLLHINGDEDDALVSSLTNKLMESLETDPELVGKVVSGITKNLYDSMGEKMKAIPNVRSAFTFYNDKTMAKEQTDYKNKIKLLEKKLVDVENKYYKQFAAMESALSKLQSQTNALAGLLGTNTGQ